MPDASHQSSLCHLGDVPRHSAARLQGAVQKEVKQHLRVQGQKALDAFQMQHPHAPPGISLKVVPVIWLPVACLHTQPGEAVLPPPMRSIGAQLAWIQLSEKLRPVLHRSSATLMTR